ncbi:hypothetical protein [Yinghuangia soli]|uniref:hypothetical protein n=1 Tax=Yinghuangia soli TaxID=2908204 RepID=UPI00355714A2
MAGGFVVAGFVVAGLLVDGLALVDLADGLALVAVGLAEVLLGAAVVGIDVGELLGAPVVGVSAGVDAPVAGAELLVPALPLASVSLSDDPDVHADAANMTATAAATDMRVFFKSFQPSCARHKLSPGISRVV